MHVKGCIKVVLFKLSQTILSTCKNTNFNTFNIRMVHTVIQIHYFQAVVNRSNL